jgi:hypothetical protein
MFESPTSGIRNFPLPQRIDAEQCIQSIISHCDAAPDNQRLHWVRSPPFKPF